MSRNRRQSGVCTQRSICKGDALHWVISPFLSVPCLRKHRVRARLVLSHRAVAHSPLPAAPLPHCSLPLLSEHSLLLRDFRKFQEQQRISKDLPALTSSLSSMPSPQKRARSVLPKNVNLFKWNTLSGKCDTHRGKLSKEK